MHRTLLALVLVLVAASSSASAQPPATHEAPASPAPVVAGPGEVPIAPPAPPRRARRLAIAGWTMFGAWTGGTALMTVGVSVAGGGSGILGAWIYPIGAVIFGFPVGIVGAGLGGRGTRLKRHPELSAALVPSASRSFAALTLRVAF